MHTNASKCKHKKALTDTYEIKFFNFSNIHISMSMYSSVFIALDVFTIH